MENELATGLNRTGLDMAPMQRDTLVKFARSEQARVPAPSKALEEVRRSYALQSGGVGSVPLPGSVKGAANTAVSALKGHKASVLIDKLGERLAFERTGVRLYEALLVKARAASSGPLLDAVTLERFRDDEESHFHMLGKYMVGLGADPTAMTPGADVIGVASSGLLKVLTDPRTSPAQALEAMVSLELTDHAGWELLIELADQTGESDMAQAFGAALETERQHMETVRAWLKQAVLEEAS